MGRITGTGTAGSPAPFLSMGAIIHRPRVVASIVCVHSQQEQGEPLRHLPASTPKHLHRREVVSKCALVRDFETLQALHRCTNYAESVPVEHESPQAPSDRPDKPKTSGEEKGVETITQQVKPVQSPSTAPQSKAEPKRWSKKEQPRKGLFSLL